jgi:hypothetical protein
MKNLRLKGAPTFKCDIDFFEKVVSLLDGDYYEWDEYFRSFKLLKYVDSELMDLLRTVTENDAGFLKYIETINAICEAELKRQKGE